MKTNLFLAFTFVFSAIVWAQDQGPTPQPVPPSLTKEICNDENEVLLADSFGKTLYVFDLDEQNVSSKCNGNCAEVWPPYILSADEIQKLTAPLATITRANGKTQLTYNGRPVYTYIFDRSIGDDKGDGIGNVWHYIEIKK